MLVNTPFPRYSFVLPLLLLQLISSRVFCQDAKLEFVLSAGYHVQIAKYFNVSTGEPDYIPNMLVSTKQGMRLDHGANYGTGINVHIWQGFYALGRIRFAHVVQDQRYTIDSTKIPPGVVSYDVYDHATYGIQKLYGIVGILYKYRGFEFGTAVNLGGYNWTVFQTYLRGSQTRNFQRNDFDTHFIPELSVGYRKGLVGLSLIYNTANNAFLNLSLALDAGGK